MRFMKKVLAEKYALPERLVMLDCEMTGVVAKRDSLLQVAALKLVLDGKTYRVEGEPFTEYLAFSGRPKNDFQKKYLTHIFDACNKSTLTPTQLKDKLHTWLGGWKGKVMPTGDCVPTDIMFLLEKGCIDSPDISDSGQQLPSTFHYEFFEMNSIKEVARVKQGKKELDVGEEFDKEGVHDALVDCKNQTLELNAILSVLL